MQVSEVQFCSWDVTMSILSMFTELCFALYSKDAKEGSKEFNIREYKER